MNHGLSAEFQDAVQVYRRLIEAWNRCDAQAYAALFAVDCHVTGFDGSQMDGRSEVEAQLSSIFVDHATAAYVAKVREVRVLGDGVTLLRAIVGMVPPDQKALSPAANAIQNLVLVTNPNDDMSRIALFQNTPAAFHGRAHLAEAMTAELAEVLRSGRLVDAA